MTENNAANGNRTKPTMLRYPLLAIGGIVLVLAGFALGRAYPAHDYHQIGTSSYLFDTHTGKLCAPFRESEEAYRKTAAGSDIASALGAKTDQTPRAATDMIPSCGSD